MNRYIRILISTFLFLVSIIACNRSNSSQQLSVVATAVPHAEILEQIKPDLKAKGIDLHIIVVDDYNTPNRALADGEVEANFFQHLPFLNLQNDEFNYHLEALELVHVEPMGLYSKKISSLKGLREGSVVAIPNDPTNEARALALLEKAGLIELNRHDVNTTVHNITSNPLKLKFNEIDSPLLARTLDDAVLAAITTNFALQSGLFPKNALAQEDKDSLFANIVAIRQGEANREEIQALKEVLHTDKVRNFIIDHYKGAIIPAF